MSYGRTQWDSLSDEERDVFKRVMVRIGSGFRRWTREQHQLRTAQWQSRLWQIRRARYGPSGHKRDPQYLAKLAAVKAKADKRG